MEKENTETVVDNKSTILTEEQVNNVVEGKKINENLEETVTLPSDDVIPEKYVGKTAEEVYKLMKIENDYKKNQDTKTEDTKVEDTKTEDNKEEIPEDVVKEYTEKLLKNGGEFTEEDYKKLAEQGYSKDLVDNYKKGVETKQAEEIKQTFIEAETTQEEFKKAGEWARDNWSETRITEFNEAINEAYATNNKTIQKALIRSLTDGFNNAPKKVETFHSNTPNVSDAITGYDTKSSYIKDANDPRYAKDPSFRKIVEQKYLKRTF